jgi:hypothetical protein
MMAIFAAPYAIQVNVPPEASSEWYVPAKAEYR